MTYMPKIDRRSFVIGTAAAGAGLALGFDLTPSAEAADATPEVNAWVVINPDDSVVIRIAKSEMGQGTLTGLAQLTAEELGCDWSKVSTEFPDPRAERRAQARLGRLLHRRQPGHPLLERTSAQGRRRGAHDADPGGRRRVEGAG